jgi:hypothetical protein
MKTAKARFGHGRIIVDRCPYCRIRKLESALRRAHEELEPFGDIFLTLRIWLNDTKHLLKEKE